MSHFWACGNCGAGGKGDNKADSQRLMDEHTNNCAAMAKLIIESKLREHAEMLELLREVLAQRNELFVRPATFDSIAALLAKFPR